MLPGEFNTPKLITVLIMLAVFAGSKAALSSDLLIGMSAAFSGPTRGLGIELYRGSVAFLNRVNEQGGVHGKKIRLICYDDGYNPGPTIRNTIRLVEKDNVFLLMNYVGTPTVTRILPLLKKYNQRSNIFLFFPFTGAQPQREYPYNRYVFNLRASYSQEIAVLIDNLVSVGRRRIAVFYQIDAYGRSGWDAVRNVLGRYGLKMVGEATYYRGATFSADMSEQVNILKKSKPDAIVSIGAYAACAAFIRDARDAGLDVPIANVSFVDSERQLKLLLEAGKRKGVDYTQNLINSQVVPSIQDTSLPAVAQYRSMMLKYAQTPPKRLMDEGYIPHKYSPVSLEGFLNAKMIVEILRRLGPYPRRHNILTIVENIHSYDLGIDVKVSFSDSRHQGLDVVYLMTVKDDRFVQIPDLKSWEID